MGERTGPPVGLRSRVALSRILEVLGPTLLRPVSPVPAEGPDGEVFDVISPDPIDEQVAGPGDLVLGVGLEEPGSVAALLARLGPRGAAALVVKVPARAGDAEGKLREAAAATAVPLLGLTRGASWAQVSGLVRSLLAPVGGGRGDLPGGPGDDLFGLADAVSAILDAPVTIEDRSSRVLAFSGRQDEADPGRRETILGRRVPERYTRMLEERGAFRQLVRGGAPVYVEALTEEMLPRVAVSVRAGEEVLGSMWAAVPGPLSPDRERGFVDAAKVVALHLLRLRAGADVGVRLRADLLAT
ncbi:MAG: PucR family transcriptional regulator, partial [Acidimicrobiales bacterium]